MPPDLNDPDQRAAYHRELRGVARPVRTLGAVIAVLAMAVAAARARWPQIPMAVPVGLLVVAALHLLAGIVLRAKYHQARMKG